MGGIGKCCPASPFSTWRSISKLPRKAALLWLTGLLCFGTPASAEALHYIDGQPYAFRRIANGSYAKGIHGNGVSIMASYRGMTHGLAEFRVLVENQAPQDLDVSPAFMTAEAGKTVAEAVPIQEYCKQLEAKPDVIDVAYFNGQQRVRTLGKSNVQIAAELRDGALIGTTLPQGGVTVGAVYFKLRKPEVVTLTVRLGEGTYSFPFSSTDCQK